MCVQATTDPAVLAAASKCPYIQQVVVSHKGSCYCSSTSSQCEPAGGWHERIPVIQQRDSIPVKYLCVCRSKRWETLRWCRIPWVRSWPSPRRPGQHLQAQVVRQNQLQRLARPLQAPLEHQVPHPPVKLAGRHYLYNVVLPAPLQEVQAVHDGRHLTSFMRRQGDICCANWGHASDVISVVHVGR